MYTICILHSVIVHFQFLLYSLHTEPFITSSLLSTMTLLSTSMNTVSSIAPTTSSIVTLSTPTVKTTSEDRRVNTVSSITIGESSAVVNRFTPAAPATPATETSDLTIVVVVVVLVLVVILLVAISLVAALVVWKVRKGKYSFSQASYHKEDNNGDGEEGQKCIFSKQYCGMQYLYM